jgi:hypothetical protein
MIVGGIRNDHAWRRRGHHEVRRYKVVCNHLNRRPIQQAKSFHSERTAEHLRQFGHQHFAREQPHVIVLTDCV